MVWTRELQEKWIERYEAGKYIAKNTGDWAFEATRGLLVKNLPSYVTGVQAVTNYTSLTELKDALQIRPVDKPIDPMSTVAAIVGHEFLVPDDPRYTHEKLLEEAVELSSEKSFIQKRRSFWRWRREFFNDKGIKDQTAIVDLLEEEKKAIRKSEIKMGLKYAFMVCSIAIGLLSGPLTLVGIGGLSYL